jgi:hypothetical protein
MPEIKLDTSDIDGRFWSAIERERVTFENSQNKGSTSLPLEYNSETNNE